MLQMLAGHLAHPGVLDAVERGERRGMVLVGKVRYAVLRRRHGGIKFDDDAKLFDAYLFDAIGVVVANDLPAAPAALDRIRDRRVECDRVPVDRGDDAIEIEIERRKLN